MQSGAGRRFEDELPSITAVSTFMKSWHGRRDLNVWGAAQNFMGVPDFSKGGFFGLVGNSKASKIGERW